MATTKTRKVTKTQGERVLKAVAAWMGRQGYGPELGQPVPTGEDAAYRGLGPMLNMEWSWPSNGPTPTVILEGGPYDWAVEVGWDPQFQADTKGIYTEPYSGYALCIYRED